MHLYPLFKLTSNHQQVFEFSTMDTVQKAKRKQDDDFGNAKKRTRNEENHSKNSINRMEEAFLRFPHLPEQIFEKLDNKSLTNSRAVGISWQNFIDERRYPWAHFLKDVMVHLKEDCDADETAFHMAVRCGYKRSAEIIMENSTEKL